MRGRDWQNPRGVAAQNCKATKQCGGLSMVHLQSLLVPKPPPFALLYRPHHSTHSIEIFTGDAVAPQSIADISIDPSTAWQGSPRQDVLALVPYQQIAERGFSCHVDGTPLLALVVHDHATMGLQAALAELPQTAISASHVRFDLNDEQYARTVQRVIDNEIGAGEGSNFVIKRSLLATVDNYSPLSACALFRLLLRHETGAYWTFVIHTGELTLVGASPERHICLNRDVVVMNPISGTYLYPAEGPNLDGLLRFLSDRKETDELFMVLDEELKMMATICDRGGRVAGPYLKEMAHLAHTEYFIEGETGLDAREVLRRSLLAPTVTGSPLESACRAIQRHEPDGRGYYSGVLALIGRDAGGQQTIDSAIAIRTAHINAQGALRLSVGSTIVRHSDPAREAVETRAKAAALASLLTGKPGPVAAARPPAATAARLSHDTRVLELLSDRNAVLAPFWLRSVDPCAHLDPHLAGYQVLVVDAEDTFTQMLAHQLRALGVQVRVTRFDEQVEPDGFDLVVVGPGPGDPRRTGDRKIAILRDLLRGRLERARPLLAVCLGHQVLAGMLGFRLARRKVPNQGTQKVIDLFGRTVRVGFYNTFSAFDNTAASRQGAGHEEVEVCADPGTREIHALRGATFRSFQFHPESALSIDGFSILHTTLAALLPERIGDRQ
jgi:2-amino-4-deoxychorismate synthase